MDTPLPPTHLDECKYTCTIGDTFVMTWTLPLPRLMWSVISWDTLERWATLDHPWICEYSILRTHSLHINSITLVLCWGFQLGNTLCRLSYRYGVDSSYNFVMSEVDCSTNNYLVILQCSYSSFTGSCVQNRDEVSVVCCESFSTYVMCLWYSCMVMELRNILIHTCVWKHS